MKLFGSVLETPIGELGVLVDETGSVVCITFHDAVQEDQLLRHARCPGAEVHWDEQACTEVLEQLRQYFAGERREFDLPLAPRGTPFQLRVWKALVGIPFGTTISYGELARRVEIPGASRAVGQANNRNPIPVVIPCHRVIGGDGALTGFGGGLHNKRWLLGFESGQGAFA